MSDTSRYASCCCCCCRYMKVGLARHSMQGSKACCDASHRHVHGACHVAASCFGETSLSCTYLAHHELESVLIIIIIITIFIIVLVIMVM